MDTQINFYRILESNNADAFILNIKTSRIEKNIPMTREKLKEFLTSEEIKQCIQKDWEYKLEDIRNIVENKIYQCKTIDAIEYHPYNVFKDKPKFQNKDGRIIYNTFTKAKFWNLDNINAINNINKSKCINSKKYPNISKLLNNLFEDNEIIQDFMLWLGYILFKPEVRNPVSFVLLGEQGSGKGRLKEWVLFELFGDNLIEIGLNEIKSQYLSFMDNKQLVFANEMFQQENRYQIAPKLKQLTTDEYISIEKKFVNTKYVRNYTNWVFASNEKNPLKIDSDDRRYYITFSYKMSYEDVVKLEENKGIELLYFVSDVYLLFKQQSQNYRFIPILNDTKKNLIVTNKNSFETFIHLIQNDKNFNDKIVRHLAMLNYINLDKIPVIEFHSIYSYMIKSLGFKALSFNKFTIEISKYINPQTENDTEITLNYKKIMLNYL